MTDFIATPAAFAVRVLIKGCLPVIYGGQQGISQFAGRELSPEERQSIGLPNQGRTYLYAIGDVGVHVDLDGANATIWFAGADCEDAIVYLRESLSAAYPDFTVQSDAPHPKFTGYRVCTLFGPLPNNRGCGLEVVYPVRGERRESESFVIRVTAAVRRGAQQASPGGGLAPGSAPLR